MAHRRFVMPLQDKPSENKFSEVLAGRWIINSEFLRNFKN
jgi:hypothetical protein